MVLGLWLPCAAGSLAAQDLTLYDDQLAPGFEDWSWATHDLANTDPVAVGTRSISFEADGWEGLYFHSATLLDLADWAGLRLYVHGGAGGGQQVRLTVQLGSSTLGEIALAPAPAGVWEQRELDFRDAGMSLGGFDGIIFQDTTGGDQPEMFLDQLELIEDTSLPPPPQPVSVVVDPDADRRPISPRVYGVNFGDANRVAEMGYPVRRWGGNATTRYNWEFDISNRASDWFFQNIPGDVPDPGQLPDGSSSDRFIDETIDAGLEPLMTATAVGWAPVDDRTKLWGFSVAQYGPQLLDECSFFDPNPPDWCTADSGNGTCDPAVNTTGFCSSDGLIVGNDPHDTSQPIGPPYTTAWMAHVASRVGDAGSGGVRFWAVDNEPMLWNSTHRDVHPDPATYDELWDRTLALATAVKTQDPGAQVLGPAVWGWCAFFTSAADAAVPQGGCVDGPDRQAHGGLPLLQWYLEQDCAAAAAGGVRPIDYLDVHFYPQGGVSGLGGAGEDPATAARRLRSVRELWDPTWVSESWINEPIYLIPRLRQWIDASCPGVGIALTEYRWGSDDGGSSALAHAEVLALFGREGVDLATRWVAPEPDTLVESSFRIFLDYDGAGSRVDGDSVRATSDDADALGSYAVRGADDTLWILLINRETHPLDVSVASSSDWIPMDAPIYRFDSAAPLAFAGTVAVGTGAFDLELPARSASLVVTRLGGATIFSDGFESGDTSAWSATLP
jgi:Glycoside hydrolase family 44